jgi:ribosomal subunit interface protein
MQIHVSGKHLDIGDALRSYVETDLEHSITKYFEHAISAEVVFTKVRHLFKVDILVNDGTGNNELVKGNAEDDDVYSAFDLAAARIAKQLRRYKGRIKNHHKSRLDKNFEMMGGTKYVIASGYAVSDMYQKEDASPVIIAEKPAVIESLTVSDAVMRMDLGQLPALMFINQATGAVNVVYRRDDGNISWIDAGDGKSAAAA